METFLKIQQLNPNLLNSSMSNKTISELMAIDINSLNGINRGIATYDNKGRKVMTEYYSDIIDGLIIRKTFTDVLESGKLTAIHLKIEWFTNIGTAVEKNLVLKFSDFDIYKLLIKRRRNVIDYLLYQGSLSSIANDYDTLFDHLNSGINSWVNTGKVTKFNTLINDTSNTEITDLLAIEVQAGVTLKQYLISYIN